MRDATHALFNPKTIKKLCSNVAITSTQRKAANEWLQLLESGQLEKEKQNYFKFALIILKDLLGYPVKEEMRYEEGNVEFTFENKEGRKVVCFEAKGTETKDLFAPQYRDKKEHSTPVKQTWDYMGSLNLDYGVTTNYRDFVLIDKSKGTSKYHLLDRPLLQLDLILRIRWQLLAFAERASASFDMRYQRTLQLHQTFLQLLISR